MKLMKRLKGLLYNSKIGFEFLLITRRVFPQAGLNRLDEEIKKYLPQQGGVFIEAGANDGISQSNTYYLERKCGWSGILIEPVPRLYERCKKVRLKSNVFNYALVSPDNHGSKIELVDMGLMSLVKNVDDKGGKEYSRIDYGELYFGRKGKSIFVEGRTLSSIIDQGVIGVIDLLVLDIEGYEFEALLGLDLDRHRPKFIVVETLDFAQIELYLRKYYEFERNLSHHDYLFKRLI